MKKKATGYVVYCVEHLRDGIEECTKVFDRKEDALACINEWANGFAGDNCTFSLYELGKQIKLTEHVEETTQPTIKRKRYT